MHAELDEDRRVRVPKVVGVTGEAADALTAFAQSGAGSGSAQGPPRSPAKMSAPPDSAGARDERRPRARPDSSTMEAGTEMVRRQAFVIRRAELDVSWGLGSASLSARIRRRKFTCRNPQGCELADTQTQCRRRMSTSARLGGGIASARAKISSRARLFFFFFFSHRGVDVCGGSRCTTQGCCASAPSTRPP